MISDKTLVVIRGGSWGDSPEIFVRATFAPVARYECLGFRTSLPARQPRA